MASHWMAASRLRRRRASSEAEWQASTEARQAMRGVTVGFLAP